jgi:cytoplasmic iron level regulating protein YaaA (DUF328/UPF0246 family)
MKILLSPAKTIQNVSFRLNLSSSPSFQEESNYLVHELRKFSVKELMELMHVSEDIAQVNFERYRTWSETSNKNSSVPAVLGFNGEVYKGFDARTLNDNELKLAQKMLLILSGLYGVLKPLDQIQPYRLEMGLKWKIDDSYKNLYAFWGDKITDFINEELKPSEPIINLASTEYFKALHPKNIKSRIVTPTFKEFKNGSFKTVMMYAKHERGAMARHIIQSNINDVEKLKLYNENRYEYDMNQSSENEWVFVR